MTITIDVPKQLLTKVWLTEDIVKRYLEEMLNRLIMTQFAKKKIEKFVKDYEDLLPETDEEVMDLVQ